MRPAVAWLVVNVAFVAINALGALILFSLFRALQSLAPELTAEPWITYPVALLGIGATLAIAFKVARLIGRPPRGRGRAQG